MLYRLIRSVLFMFVISLAVAICFISDLVIENEVVRQKNKITELHAEKKELEAQLKVANDSNGQLRHDVDSLVTTIVSIKKIEKQKQSTEKPQDEIKNIDSTMNEQLSFIHTQISPRNGTMYNPDGIELVYVEGKGDIQGFYIGKFEITQSQWVSIMGDNPSHFKGTDQPVERVSWNDTQKFLKQLNDRTSKNYRLPTEAEWEFAARGGTASKGYEYSGSNNIDDVAWYKNNSKDKPHPVGSKLPNELGIHDMSGNVEEWCLDTLGPKRDLRVCRGGFFRSSPQDCCYSSRKASFSPSFMYAYFGLRVVLPH